MTTDRDKLVEDVAAYMAADCSRFNSWPDEAGALLTFIERTHALVQVEASEW